MPEKQRLDRLLHQRGLADSREKAKALIMAGQVLVDDRPVEKAGASVPVDADIRLREQPRRFVSRGGEKLIAALEDLQVDPAGKRWLDIGQSTGGFTDVLLQQGAVHVTGVDVGYGQLDYRLRTDPRVTCRERTNARNLEADAFGGEKFDGAVIDVSFISLTLILPSVSPHIKTGGRLLTLVKPQFEAGREQVGKGGVVRDETVIAACVEKIKTFAADNGLTVTNELPSPVLGPKGNQEVFLLLEKRS